MKAILLSSFLFLAAFCLNAQDGPPPMPAPMAAPPQGFSRFPPPPYPYREPMREYDEGRYRIIESADRLMKLDAETGRTWVFEPARGFGQVDIWEEVTNY